MVDVILLEREASGLSVDAVLFWFVFADRMQVIDCKMVLPEM